MFVGTMAGDFLPPQQGKTMSISLLIVILPSQKATGQMKRQWSIN